MTAPYWPDLDCTSASRAIAHPLTVHEHFADEQAACRALLAYLGTCTEQLHDRGETDADMKYRCIRGPGGLVRGVRR